MTSDQRDIRRKLRLFRHAEANGSVVGTCRYFGIGRASFYRWKAAYARKGEAGLINGKTIPRWHANRTPPEIEEKVIHLRRKYHLGPIRIMWYLACGILSDIMGSKSRMHAFTGSCAATT